MGVNAVRKIEESHRDRKRTARKSGKRESEGKREKARGRERESGDVGEAGKGESRERDEGGSRRSSLTIAEEERTSDITIKVTRFKASQTFEAAR